MYLGSVTRFQTISILVFRNKNHTATYKLGPDVEQLIWNWI